MNDPQGFSQEQQYYLQGLALGTDVARKVVGLPVLANSAAPGVSLQLGSVAAPLAKLTNEENAKQQRHPLDRWDEMQERATNGKYPQGIDVFLQKYFGMFYVAPAQDSYMCRLRFAGGAIRSYQFAGLAELADRYAGPYVDVTTRANLQLREIGAADPIHVLYGLRDLGILNMGAGADNIRNVTASPLSGIDPHELAETLPLARDMHHYILSHRDLYDLPRKFNIAFDGGGNISALEETNDIGFRAVRVQGLGQAMEVADGIYFQLSLGGITGHRDFARPSTIVLTPDECVSLAATIVRLFIKHGDRTDRKRARLKYLLDAWGHERFLELVEQEWNKPLRHVSLEHIVVHDQQVRNAHVGVHPQKQSGLNYVGVVLPVGRITTDQMRSLARIADQWGSGDLRLTVWQNLILPNIPDAHVAQVTDQIRAIGLDWNATNIRAGLVACTGSAGCKYAGADTKHHALMIAEYVEERLDLDQPINIHLTGCHHSCAQHYIGDIGMQGTQVEEGDDLVEGYHIYVGGGHGTQRTIARQLFPSVPFAEIPPMIVRLLETYLERRTSSAESFVTFAHRMSLEDLQAICRPSQLVV